jgi:hypothetical protein
MQSTIENTPSLEAVCEVAGVDLEQARAARAVCSEVIPQLRQVLDTLGPLLTIARTTGSVDLLDDDNSEAFFELVGLTTGRSEVFELLVLLEVAASEDSQWSPEYVEELATKHRITLPA